MITARKRSLRRLCFYTCHSVHRGVSAPVHAGIHTPPRDQRQTPPSSRHHPLEQTPAREDNPPAPEAVHAGRYGQQAGGTHPTGMNTCYY